MTPIKKQSKKKIEWSLTNWILGGDLISVVEEKSTETEMDVKKVKHRRKAFARNSDGTYSTIELPEDFDYKTRRYRRGRHRRRSSSTIVDDSVQVDNQCGENNLPDRTEEIDNEAKGGDETEDEKPGNHAKKNKKKGIMTIEKAQVNTNDSAPENMKWCVICKIPSPDGTSDTMPEGAKKGLCGRCDRVHWIRQCDDKEHARWCKEQIKVFDEFIDHYEKLAKNNKTKADKEKKNGAVAADAKEKEKVDKKGGASRVKWPDTDTETVIATTDDEGVVTWTAEQDKMILDMKADNKTWAVIASTVKADREAVKERFRELQKSAPKSEVAKPPMPATAVDEIDENFGIDLFGDLSAEDAKVLSSLDGLLAKSSPEAEKKVDSEKETEVKQTKEASTKAGKENNNGNGNKKKEMNGKKKNNNHTEVPKHVQNFPSGPAISNSPTNSPNSSPKCVPKPYSHSHRSNGVASTKPDPDNGGFHFGPRFYGKLKPDAVWSKDDCDLLEHLLERYDNEKWLNMQASFFNWTGRMIAAEFIERKFKADYGPHAFEEGNETEK